MKLCEFEVGLDRRFFLIDGPCVVESEQLQMDVAGRLKEMTSALGIPFIFKSSYDKANRSSGSTFRGPDMERGLEILAKVRRELGVPILTDVHSESEVPAVAAVVDVLQTPNLEVINNAMVREVLTNSSGMATGVSYVSKDDMQEYEVSAKVVVLVASACESARLLLNSKSSFHPNVLADSSNIVGKYLHDCTGVGMGGILPKLFNRKRYNEDGVGGIHIYSPWWLDNKKLDFPSGYHIEYRGGMSMPSYGFGFGVQNYNGKYPDRNGNMKPAGGYGASLKDDHRYFYGSTFGMDGRGEAIPREDNYCEIDPNVVDKFGIPVLRFHYKWSDYEIKQAKHMQETFQEIIHKTGATITWGIAGADTNYGLAAPGRIIHEVGTVRMGNDKKKSALNKFNQAHDCKNLFVVDGGAFVSQADKSPTWTILALSWRASDYIIEQIKQQNL